MKNITICILSFFFAISVNGQSQDEIQYFNLINNEVLNTLSDIGGNYLIIKSGAIPKVIEKTNSGYNIYTLSADYSSINEQKNITSNLILDQIFSSFVPVSGVSKYLSETNYSDLCPIMQYFAIYKNHEKQFDSYLPYLLNCREEPTAPFDMKYPYNEDILGLIIELFFL